jgi:acetate kinase
MTVLVVNAGSSSLKLRLLDDHDQVLATADLAGGARLDGAAVDRLRADAGGAGIDAVGHRVVHGGPDFTAPTVVRGDVRDQLARLVELAPLHVPAALAGIDAAAEALPGVPAVACFDTAFHASMPAAAATYAVPAQWREQWGVRRYGFHGLSYGYAWRRAVELTGRDPGTLRVVACHLGSGASVCALAGGVSQDTTMGFTPLEGLVMATRSGTVDPGLVLWLQRERGLSAADVEEALERRSGLLGLAGTGDLREVLERAHSGDAAAQDALAVHGHRLRREIGAMTAALGGLDVLLFTGGVGEHAPAVRAAAADGLAHLGVAVDPDRNADTTSDGEVSADGAAVATLVVTAREDLQIAREVRAALR